MTDLETFVNSIYFAVFASFGISFAIAVVWIALERFKESRKEK